MATTRKPQRAIVFDEPPAFEEDAAAYAKERHPATGLVHRVNVYRLNDGYWDCYREEELQAA